MNIKKSFIYSAISLSVLISGLLINNNLVSAQAAGTGQALEIAPPVLNLIGDPGETINSSISLRDISSGSLLVTSEINDFTAEGEDGTPKIILDEGEVNPYSLKTWIKTIPSLTLKPRQIEQIPISISIPTNAAPGGYYAVIRFSGIPPELEGTGMSLSASLGALVLLRVSGETTEKLSIEEFSVSQENKIGSLFESTSKSLPIKFIERIKNSGNIHEQPSGQIIVTDMFGKDIVTLNINLPPRDILPDSIRKFEQPLDSDSIGNTFLFGKYTAKLNVTYGASGEILTKSIEFWVIPYRLIAIIAISVVVLIVTLVYGIKRYNRFIINQASKPSKNKKH